MLDKHRLISEGDTPKRATLICYTWCLVIAIQTDKINVSYYLTILKDKTNSKQTVHSTNSTKYYKAVSSRCVPSIKIAHCKTRTGPLSFLWDKTSAEPKILSLTKCVLLL